MISGSGNDGIRFSNEVRADGMIAGDITEGIVCQRPLGYAVN